MQAWFGANIANIIVLLILLAVVGFAIFSIIKNHRKGKSSCGCDCGSCPMGETCRKDGKQGIS